MKKILHLICNSHIDPVWQWDWDEGVSATLSTFYTACNLLDKYDFIFCHNEALYSVLYFPHGDGTEIAKDTITLSNKNIVISALERGNNGEYLIRLYNGKEKKDSVDLQINDNRKHISFVKFEFKTFVFDGKRIIESEDASIY